MKVTNDGQLTSAYNRRTNFKQFVIPHKDRNKPNYYEIHQECNKPLQSKFAVEAHGKPRMEWYSHNCLNNKLRTQHFGNTWYETDRAEEQFHDVGSPEILREQQLLYNKLKREYEKQLNNDITEEEKEKAVVRNRNIKLLQGLTSSPRYDRIYTYM